jgi:hypothetical protein
MNDDSARLIEQDSDKQELKDWERISFYWGEQPSMDCLSVVLLQSPAGESECPLV